VSLPSPLNRPRIRLASRVFHRLLGHFLRDPLALHYAVRIFIGTAFLWILLQRLGDSHAIWAIISMVFVTEPQIKLALENFRHRIYNTAVGCGIGIVSLLVAGPRHWVLPLAIAIAVLLSTRAPDAPASWRVTPIATGIVLTAGLAAQSWAVGLQTALIRAGEVFLGGATAIAIAWVMSLVWMPEEEKKAEEGTPV
jgi:uncharacterized membrane protein YccC